MKIHAFILTWGVIGAVSVAHAQKAPEPPDPLSDLQKTFGAIVGEAFHRPDPVVAAISTPGSPVVEAGKVLRTSMEIPGAVFAAPLKPFADADAAADKAAAPPPAAAPAPKSTRHRHARVRHHHVAKQG